VNGTMARKMRRSIVILCIAVVLLAAVSAASTFVFATLVVLTLLAVPATGGVPFRWTHAARSQRRSLLSLTLLRAPPVLLIA
jgi:hypothetical protein